MSDNPADAITDDLRDKARSGMESIAAELERRMRERLSVQVSGSGRNKVRSKPGEDPRREYGDYQGSWRHSTAVNGDTITAAAGTDMERGVWLEKGTGRMAARPHASKLAAEFGGVVVAEVGDVFAEAVKS